MNASVACTVSGEKVYVHGANAVASSRATPSIAPPNAAGDALSGCPSICEASVAMTCVPSPSDNAVSASAAPATRAAADEPSPRATGIVEVTSNAMCAGNARPARAHAAWKPVCSRSSAASHVSDASEPARDIVTPIFDSSITTVAVSHRSTAIPTQSNPPPRFEVLPGTWTVACMTVMTSR